MSRGRGPGGQRLRTWPRRCLVAAVWTTLFALRPGAAAAEDPIIAAARAAIADGQPAQAVSLLRGHRGLETPGPARVALARARLALGDPAGALAVLALGDDERLAGWAPGVRGEAAEVAARAQIASGADAKAGRLLAIALADGRGDDPGCLVLAAELAAAAGDRERARRLGGTLWNRRPRSVAAAPAGLLLARLADDDVQARTVLAEVRAMPGLTPALRLAAAEQLCRVLLAGEPGACLVVAEQELARAGVANGRLPLWRALAITALDPADGLAALTALPPALGADPAAQAMATRARAELAAGRGADAGQRLERARAAAEMERWDEVRTLVGALAGEHEPALILLARAPDADLSVLVRLPTASRPAAALALGAAFATRGQAAAAWAALAPALAALDRGDGEVPAAPTLHWAIEAARAVQPQRVPALEARLRALPDGVEVGQAWAREAERLAEGGLPAAAAWARAARALPEMHPWRLTAAAQTARAALAGDGDLDAAATALAPALVGEAAADRLRCRFLLAQIEARRGRNAEARRIAEDLRAHADADQAARLADFLAALPAGR